MWRARRKIDPGSTLEENCINQVGLRREKQTQERGDPKADGLQSRVGAWEFAHQLDEPVALQCG